MQTMIIIKVLLVLNQAAKLVTGCTTAETEQPLYQIAIENRIAFTQIIIALSKTNVDQKNRSARSLSHVFFLTTNLQVTTIMTKGQGNKSVMVAVTAESEQPAYEHMVTTHTEQPSYELPFANRCNSQCYKWIVNTGPYVQPIRTLHHLIQIHVLRKCKKYAHKTHFQL